MQILPIHVINILLTSDLEPKLIKLKRITTSSVIYNTAFKIHYLSNTTSKLQPMDDIIKNFKSLYQKEVVRNMLDNMEEKKNSTINVLHAMRMVNKVWRNVTATTIKNCYVHCGFSSSSTEEAETEDISPPAEWNTLVSESGSFENFVTCDDRVTAETLSDDEIIDSVAQKTDTND
ncbi:unnamed protein product [Euphydryas editha]|uniref:DDE-1 domain-containing protein n=1 Tax=Euphydryas editha TaxID=104508 RepID=A0AAU9TUS6_EUPED|nr:unnamed protein product [Euphydryas editha]